MAGDLRFKTTAELADWFASCRMTGGITSEHVNFARSASGRGVNLDEAQRLANGRDLPAEPARGRTVADRVADRRLMLTLRALQAQSMGLTSQQGRESFLESGLTSSGWDEGERWAKEMLGFYRADEPTITPGEVRKRLMAVSPSDLARPAASLKVSAAPRKGSLSRLRGPSATRPRPATRKAFMTAVNGTTLPDTQSVAQAIVNKRLAFGNNIPEDTHGECLSVATGHKETSGYALSPEDYEANTETLNRASREQGAIVASGSSCAPFTPLYDFYRLAEPQSPIEDGIPVVDAPRGGVRYIQSPDYTQALGAVGTSTLPKPVAVVTCPTIADQAVEAISQIVQFDNLQYRVFPEQVEAFLEDAATIFALTKEVAYLTYIDANSTAVSSNIPYGAVGSLMYDWTTSAVAFRKRHGMRRGTPVSLMAPDWSLDMVKLDMVENGYQGLDFLNVPDDDVEAALRSRGLEPIWYNDTLSGGDQKFNTAQAAGGLNAWPTKVRSYIHGIGTFIRLDGGTLDVGVVRDSALNKTNDLQIFMEEWLGMIKVAPEAIRLDSLAPCPNGVRGGNAVASGNAFACPIA